MTNRKILFVDDQWCREDNQDTIIAAFGELFEQGYKFVYDTARDIWGGYSELKVVETIRENSPLCAVVCDMNFTQDIPFSDIYFNRYKKFGKTILKEIVKEFPDLPVIMHSSESDKDLIQECLDIGARAWLPKKATLEQLTSALQNCKEVNENGR